MNKKLFYGTLLLFIGFAITVFLLSDCIQDIHTQMTIKIYGVMLMIVSLSSFLAPFAKDIGEPMLGITMFGNGVMGVVGLFGLLKKLDPASQFFTPTFMWYHFLTMVILASLFFLIIPIREKFMKRCNVDIVLLESEEDSDLYDSSLPKY